jgi:hypothetical protein
VQVMPVERALLKLVPAPDQRVGRFRAGIRESANYLRSDDAAVAKILQAPWGKAAVESTWRATDWEA